MSATTLHCPTCDAPVPPRIETNLRPVLERFTCEVCGRTTLREELVRRANLRMAGGGAPASGSPPHVPVFGLLETLRPTGDLGDQSDATLVSRTATSAATLQVPQTILSLADLTVVPVSISYLRFFARAGYFFSALGPIDPLVWVRWRLGAAGTIVNGDGATIGGGVGVYAQVDGLVLGVQNIETDPDGNPWTVANVNNLRMAGVFGVVDDNGSGETTTCQTTELWAEVWGYI